MGNVRRSRNLRTLSSSAADVQVLSSTHYSVNKAVPRKRGQKEGRKEKGGGRERRGGENLRGRNVSLTEKVVITFHSEKVGGLNSLLGTKEGRGVLANAISSLKAGTKNVTI